MTLLVRPGDRVWRVRLPVRVAFLVVIAVYSTSGTRASEIQQASWSSQRAQE